jgi:hypothetical protein
VKKIIILSVMLIGVFLVSPAASQDGPWRQFYTNSAGNTFYYDQDSVSYNDSDYTARADVKVAAAREGAGPRELTMVVQINCEKEWYRRLEWQVPGPEGSVRTVKNPSEWSRIPDRSHLEALNNIICKSFKGRRTDR